MDTALQEKFIKRLGIKTQDKLLILNAPENYIEKFSVYKGTIDNTADGKYDFVQGFALNAEVANELKPKMMKALNSGGLLWISYPKGSSKKYKSDINRTTLWDFFGEFEYEPVSQVAIDEDWSTIRYKHVDEIKSLTRKNAATKKGKERIKE